MVMRPLGLCHDFLLIFLVLLFLLISSFIVRVFFTVINKTVIIVAVFRIVFFIIRKVILLNIGGDLIFHVLSFFPFLEKIDYNTDDTLPEIFVNVLENLFIKKFMVFKEKFHFVFRVLFLKLVFDHDKFLNKSEKNKFEILSLCGFKDMLKLQFVIESVTLLCVDNTHVIQWIFK